MRGGQRLIDDPQCPRCGYSMRGAVDQWAESCPLDGTCTECGLGFAWCDVLCLDRVVPVHLIEFAPERFLGVLIALPRTLLASLRPFKFWRTIRLEHSLRSGRLVLYVAFLGLVVYFALSTAVAVSEWTDFALRWAGGRPRPGARLMDALEVFVMPFGPRGRSHMEWGVNVSFVAGVGFLVGVQAMFGPFVLLLLRTTMRAARIRLGHLVRIAVYCMAWPVATVGTALLADVLPWLASTVLSFLSLGFVLVLPIAQWRAVRAYLKVPHAFGVMVAGWIISSLLGIALFYYGGVVMTELLGGEF